MSSIDFIKLFKDAGLIKYGQPNEYTLNSGRKSSIYIDLKLLMGHPTILQTVAKQINKRINTYMSDKQTVAVCGAPLGAIPIATAVAIVGDRPGILLRKEQKTYGTKKLIECAPYIIKEKIPVVVIEDVVTSGKSIIQVVNQLHNAGFNVPLVVSVVSRAEESDLEKINKSFGHRCRFTSLTTLDSKNELLML